MTARRFRQVAIVTTVGVCVLVVAGGIVRLTGSGLGCDDWPNCNSETFVDVTSGHAAIEQANRLLSALIGVPAVIMAVGAFRVRPGIDGLVAPSLGTLGAILANGVVGGLAVRGDLHPALVQSHFLLALIAVTFGMVAIRRATPAPTRVVVPTGVRRLVRAVTAGAALALVTGTVVTGTGPHAGDEDVRRWGFDISTVARVHSVVVLVTVAVFLGFLVMVRRDREAWGRGEHAVTTWLAIAVVQGAIGYVQYFNGVPELLVGAHIAGATLLWVATVHLAQVFGQPPGGATSQDATREAVFSFPPPRGA